MMQTFTVISTPTTNPDEVREAVDNLREIGEVVEQTYHQNFSEWYNCPALKEPSGRMIFGIDGIRLFIQRVRGGGS
jgi:hypothetical protein